MVLQTQGAAVTMSGQDSQERAKQAESPFDFRIAGFVIEKRRVLLFLSLLLSLALAAGIPRLGFDTSIDTLLTRSDPYLDEYREFQDNFPPRLEVYFAFAPCDGESVFTPGVLDAVAELESRYREIPGAESFSGLTDYFMPQRQERLFTRSLDSYSQEELREVQQQALSDPLLTNNLLAADASLTRAVIGMDETGLSDDERLRVADAAIALRDSLRRNHPEVTLLLNSDVLLEQNSRQDMLSDLTSLLPIVILVCVLAICYCFRSAILGLCILAHVIFTVLCTLGVLGYLGFDFNSISVIAPLVVVIIAVANSVHLVSLFRQALDRGQSRPDAMAHSAAFNIRPVSLAALTTAIGFTSLNMSSSPAVQDFGRIVATGIVFAYLLTLTLLPSFLIMLGESLRRGSDQTQQQLRRGLAAVVKLSQTHDRSLFIGCTGLAVLSLALLPLNETDFNRLDFISADSEVADYYELVQSSMERGPTLTYAVDAGRVDGAIDPAFLGALERYSSWLNNLPGVESSASMVEVVKTIGVAANSDDPAYYRIPDDIDTVAYYLNSYEVVESDDFPLAGFTNSDFSMVTLFVNARALSNQALLDLDEQISAGFEDFFPDAELVHGSGLLLFARMDENVTVELMQGYTVSLVLITLTMMIGLRSIYFGLLSIVPNLLPAVIVFGFWGLFVGQVDPFVMMLFSISIGLVVDDTVHLLSHYLAHRRAGEAHAPAIEQAVTVAGPALTITTLILALGTTILIGANTLYFQQSAKLLVPIVLLALILDLLYLPTILKRFDRAPERRQSAPGTL